MNPLIRKLGSFTDLSDEDRELIECLSDNVTGHRAGRDLIREGERPELVFLLLEGWAYRYKVLPDGQRQIMAFLLPGDLCDVHIFILEAMDHSLGLLSDAKVAAIPKQRILEITERRPNLARALWWSTLVDEAVLREWLVNIGRRDAYYRIAHLFAELYLRMDMVGLADGQSFDLPLTQEALGDTLGLTAVHVNRMLQRMREEGLIRMSRGALHIPDVDRLMRETQFDSNYLHLNRRLHR
jgi:CRP-like cAMP-binding protein